jgi:hypothetical protein
MDKASVKIGEQYGARENLTRLGTPLQRVEVLREVKPGRWKVRYLDDPNPGFEDYLSSQNLLVRWEDREPLLEDERRMIALRKACRQQWRQSGDPTKAEAVEEVFESAGESINIHTSGQNAGQAEMDTGTVQRMASRAHLRDFPQAFDSDAFFDHFGTLHIGIPAVITLARTFALAEPRTVLLHVSVHESIWESKARHDAIDLEMVEGWRSQWRIAREWAEQAHRPDESTDTIDAIKVRLEDAFGEFWLCVAERLRKSENEILRLTGVIEEAVKGLRKVNALDAAEQIESQMKRTAEIPVPGKTPK